MTGPGDRHLLGRDERLACLFELLTLFSPLCELLL